MGTLDLAPLSGRVKVLGRPPLYFGYRESKPSASKSWTASRTRSALVKVTGRGHGQRLVVDARFRGFASAPRCSRNSAPFRIVTARTLLHLPATAAGLPPTGRGGCSHPPRCRCGYGPRRDCHCGPHGPLFRPGMRVSRPDENAHLAALLCSPPSGSTVIPACRFTKPSPPAVHAAARGTRACDLPVRDDRARDRLCDRRVTVGLAGITG